MADENNCCKCGTNSVGPTKATAASFSFNLCEAGEPVLVAAENIGSYVVNIIFGDDLGNPPEDGCYNVCYENGVQMIERVDEECELENQELIFGDDAEPDNAGSLASWGLAANVTRTFTLATPAPYAQITHALITVSGFASNGNDLHLYDRENKLIFSMFTGNDDDDHSSFVYSIPVPLDTAGGNTFTLHATGNNVQNGRINILHAGYAKRKGLVNTATALPNPSNDAAVPSIISVINNNVSNNTVIQWATVAGVNNYQITTVNNGVTFTSIIPHNGTCPNQKHTINWTATPSATVDVSVTAIETGEVPITVGPITSDFGAPTILPSVCETTETI